jgi:carbon starvation protein CstA
MRVVSSVIIGQHSTAQFFEPDNSFMELIWPAFGSTNQLLAALGLFPSFEAKTSKTLFISIPMVNMFVITITAMVQLTVKSSFNRQGLGSWDSLRVAL